MTRSDDVNVHVELSVEQESEPPRTILAVIVALALLDDLADYIDSDRTDADGAALLLRIGAVRAVLRRVHERLDDQ